MKTLSLFLSVLIAAQAHGQTCGAPTFNCSLHQTNAQLTVIPLPRVIPNIGNLVGANRTYTPAIYGNTIVRCTDILTDPNNKRLHSFEVTDNGGANDQPLNADETALRVVEMATGLTGVMPFENCGPVIPASIAPSGQVWHPANPNVDFSLKGTVVSQRTFDFVAKTVSSIQLFDFKSCQGLSGLPPDGWTSQLSSPDGDSIGAAFSLTAGQGTGHFAAVYQLSTGHCVVWNTLSGQISTLGQASTFFPFTIHDFTIYSGGWALVAVGNTCTGCPAPHGPFLWKIGSTQVNLITSYTGGHNTMGNFTYLNLSNSPAIVQRAACACNFSKQLSTATGVNFPTPADTHIAWGNVDTNDSAPIFATQSSQQQPQPLKITSPLEQEIFFIDPSTGKFIRIAPTMTSGMQTPANDPNNNFRTANAIGAIKNKCIVWSSDWEGTLGNTDGVTSTCTLGTAAPTQCRSDVFKVCPK
jgi:hypothetical protein